MLGPRGVAVVLAVALGACNLSGSEGPPEMVETTTTTLTTVTTEEEPWFELILDPVEALAIEAGIRLRITNETGEELGWLDSENRTLVVEGTHRLVTMEYTTASGDPAGVVWDQTVTGPSVEVGQRWRGEKACAAALPDGSTDDVVLVWQALGDTDEYLGQLDAAGGEVTVVSPVWWRMRSDGSLAGTTDPVYVAAVHDRNVAIWPAVAGFDAEAIHHALATVDRRSALAGQISEEARVIGADGVNIDIEGYRAEDAGVFVEWVVELSEAIHQWGGTVSIDIIPRGDSWDIQPVELAFWSTAPLRAELARATDCTILMAYDQYNRYRPAGPVASPPWVEEAVTYALRYTDPAKLVLGVPFYGRLWDPDELDSPRAMGIGSLEERIDEGTTTFDEDFGLDRVDLPDGTFFWAETPSGLEHRFDLVDRYGLAGWAAWRFGFDGDEIWAVVAAR